MSASRYNRLHKATALVPLALLSAAWTVNVTGLTQSSASASSNSQPSGPITLPDGTSVPSQAIDAPASVSDTATGHGVGGQSAQSMINSASAAGIPAAALAAYQRATTVINAADTTCHIDWPLIAAIGRIESNHGRANGNKLTADGRSVPGIFGPALNGKGGFTRITDTDGGQYDGDTTFDRAVGPMQFIPSTWSMVGVDADGDGKRDPQDINDAALATAVYLCSGTDDLATQAGQKAAVFRYNHSQTYVATVLAIANAYRTGDFTAIPNNTIPVDTVIAPEPAPAPKKHGHGGRTVNAGGAPKAPGSSTSGSTSTSSGSSSSGSSSSGSKGVTGSGSGTSPLPSSPSQGASSGASKATSSTKDLAATTVQLTTLCTQQLTKQFGSAPEKGVTACVNQLAGKTLPQATADVAGIVSGVIDSVLGGLAGTVGGLLGGK